MLLTAVYHPNPSVGYSFAAASFLLGSSRSIVKTEWSEKRALLPGLASI